MIDVESHVFSEVAYKLRELFPGISVAGEYVNAPSHFPHVTIVEQDNYTSPDKLDTSVTEKYSTLMYEINVYSNKTGGKKSESRAIMTEIDNILSRKNFRRISLNPVPNMENATIYRLVARYRVETDGETFYRT